MMMMIEKNYLKYFRLTLYKIAIFTIIIQEENVTCILLVCILQLAKNLLLIKAVIYGANCLKILKQ